MFNISPHTKAQKSGIGASLETVSRFFGLLKVNLHMFKEYMSSKSLFIYGDLLIKLLCFGVRGEFLYSVVAQTMRVLDSVNSSYHNMMYLASAVKT